MVASLEATRDQGLIESRAIRCSSEPSTISPIKHSCASAMAVHADGLLELMRQRFARAGDFGTWVNTRPRGSKIPSCTSIGFARLEAPGFECMICFVELR